MEATTPLTPAEAASVLREAAPLLPSETVALADGLGRVLAADLASRCDHPGIDNSALDGYACLLEDTVSATEETPVRLHVVGESAAGRPFPGELGSGEAVRIYTGATVPTGADGIVPVEASHEPGAGDDTVDLLQPASSADIRQRAEDLACGTVYLRSGQRLDAGDLALAAAMGHPSVPVVRRPRVALLTTGDEIVEPGAPLRAGEVYDSNAFSLAALAQAAGAEPVRLPRVGDDVAALERALGQVGAVDLLLTSGGVSMGRYDLVRDLLFDRGNVLFWKVAMKPGGPALFGRWGDLPVLGLPGNPVSGMVVFLVLARSFIDAALGRTDPPPYFDRRHAQAQSPFRATAGKESLARARVSYRGADILAAPLASQSSGVVRSMAEADALAVVPPGRDVEAGEPLEVIPLAGHLR